VLKGEAYFEVARNEQKPFIVNANDQAIIRVLGTHFNVSAYEDENSVKTTLVEGSVKVLSKISGRSLQISPGQQVDMDAEGGLNMKKVNTEEYTSWIDGVFLFDKESFSSVLKKVERYYNIRFAFGDPSKGDIKISGKLNLKTELEEIIEVLQTTSSTSINSIKGGYYVIK
jgi:ferric-dicitrate binding protein FerR (iron transport regulator)